MCVRVCEWHKWLVLHCTALCSQEVVAGSHYRYIYLSLHLVEIDTSSRDSMCDEVSSRSTEALTTSASLIGLPKCGHSAVITFCEEVISEVRLKILGRLVFSHSYFSYSRMEAFRNATMSCAPHVIRTWWRKWCQGVPKLANTKKVRPNFAAKRCRIMIGKKAEVL